MLKVGDRVRWTPPENIGISKTTLGWWSDCVILDIQFESEIARIKNKSGSTGTARLSCLTPFELTDQELADEYRECFQRACGLAATLIDKGYKVEKQITRACLRSPPTYVTVCRELCDSDLEVRITKEVTSIETL